MNYEKLRQAFRRVHGDYGDHLLLVRAPGRVNLMGEHTDYNQGFVLPVNLGGMEVAVAAERRSDHVLCMYSLDHDERITANLSSLKYLPSDGWANYVKGVFWALEHSGHRLSGMNLLIAGDLPQGVGLSSSAALNAATALVALIAEGEPYDLLKTAKALQNSENKFLGVHSGIMDQLSILLTPRGHALFLDCRSFHADGILLQLENAELVVIDSGVARSLKTSEYNKRREECSQALHLLKTKNDNYQALRDVSVLAFERYKAILPPPLCARAEHVIYENDRVLKARDALASGDVQTLGELFRRSHRSQAKLFQTSCEEIETLVGLAQSHAACLGIRLTGGGFGGCCVALVRSEGLENFADYLKKIYRQKTGGKANIIPVVPTDPAGAVNGSAGQGRGGKAG